MRRSVSGGWRLFFLFAPGALASGAWAQQLLMTDDTWTQDAGNHQLELSLHRERARAGGETERARLARAIYSYGLTTAFDVFVGGEYARVRAPWGGASGFGTAWAGVKWRFFEDEDSGLGLAVRPEIWFPVGEREEAGGLGVGRVSGGLTLILTQKTPFGKLHVNAGVDRERYRDSAENATVRRFSLAPVWEISEKWQLALDLGVDLIRSGGDTARRKFGEISVIYAPDEDIELSLAWIRAREGGRPGANERGLAAGVTFWF